MQLHQQGLAPKIIAERMGVKRTSVLSFLGRVKRGEQGIERKNAAPGSGS